MKIKVRKQIEQIETWENPYTGKQEKNSTIVENGFVEEMEINPMEISAFSLDKSLRLIGIGRKLYPMTLKSWKDTKKELSKTDILRRLSAEKYK